MNDRSLTDLQEDLTARLQADAMVGTLPVLNERKADLLSAIKTGLGIMTKVGGKIGACVIVMPLTGQVEYPDLPQAVMEEFVTVQVLEDPTFNNSTNGTKLAALTIARRVARVLHQYRPVGIASCLIAAKPTIVLADNPLAPLAYDVRFKTQESDNEPWLKVAAPEFAPNGGDAPQTVTITCSTPSAAIYYTLDGSHPWSGNMNATLYTAPVSVAEAGTLRAAAYLAGSIASDVNAAQYE